MSLRRLCADTPTKNGVNVAAVEASQTPPAIKPDAVPNAQDKPLPVKVAQTKAADEQKATAAILAKDTHVVKEETLQSIAISELQAEGKLSRTANGTRPRSGAKANSVRRALDSTLHS